MQLAGRGRIGHLLLKDREALGSRLKRGPVRRRAEDRLVLIDDLVVEDADAAGEVPLRIQDGLVAGRAAGRSLSACQSKAQPYACCLRS